MLKLGVIGTSHITHDFIKAAHLTKQYQLTAIYSRKIETALSFAEDYDDSVELFIDLDDFAQFDLDVVYIASPNSLHFEQAKKMMLHGKHVIIEKPAVSNPTEFDTLIELSLKQKVFCFEAARNIHENAVLKIKKFLSDKTILGANLTFAQYSSKMPKLKSGLEPTVFSAKYSGGALMDLGIYELYLAIFLFGEPLSATYHAVKLPNDIDLNGVGSLHYDQFDISLTVAKNFSSQLASEIYTTDGTLTINSVAGIKSAVFTYNDGHQMTFDIKAASHSLLEESEEFAKVIKMEGIYGDLSEYKGWIKTAKSVHSTLYKMRQDANIRFEADNDV